MGEVLRSPLTDEEKLERITPLAVGRFPDQLQDVVSKIRQALGCSITTRRQQEEALELMEDEVHRAELEQGQLHVSNAVLDNTLSTLKHETMYYPSRIRQLLDTNDTSSLIEVTAYYRELYGILSQQAMRQFDYVKMHVKALPNEVLGDKVYMDYLFEILQRQAGKKKLTTDWQPRDEHYVTARVTMDGLILSDEQIHTLFMPIGISNIPYLICREIVRRHAEATNCHACGIRAERNQQQQIQIIITLPRICKTSKSLS
jgi:hypothetical protein